MPSTMMMIVIVRMVVVVMMVMRVIVPVFSGVQRRRRVDRVIAHCRPFGRRTCLERRLRGPLDFPE